MARVLLTGMSGAGKSTLLAAAARRGYRTVDTDHDGWELADALWDEPRMSALLAEHATVAVGGTAQNQGRFYDRFEHVIYLRVPLEVLLQRVRTRTNNPYGKTAEQQADITRYVAEVEPVILRTVTLLPPSVGAAGSSPRHRVTGSAFACLQVGDQERSDRERAPIWARTSRDPRPRR